MTTIGTFTRKPDGTFEGNLATLTMQARLRLVPLEDKTSGKEPDYRVYTSRAEVGAAWHRESTAGKPYLSVSLDDPSFAAPVTVALFPIEGDPDRHVLVWNRQRRE